MMDHQEATASLDLFSDQLVQLCASYDSLIDRKSGGKNDLIEKVLGKLKQVKRDSSVVHFAVSNAIDKQYEQLIVVSVDGLTKLVEALHRNLLAIEEADDVLRSHDNND
jgi:hypothetical protein